MSNPPAPLKVFLLCTGVGKIRGGIESFFQECFDGLRGTPGLELHLFKGAGEETDREHRMWSLHRRGWVANAIGKLLRRNGYIIEQMSTLPGYIRVIKKMRPDILFTSDANLTWRLYPRRKKMGVPFRIIYSNGGPIFPPYRGCDMVQQVAPYFLEQGREYKYPDERMSLVPYGITVPEGDPPTDPAEKIAARRALGLPLDRKIVISVGWLSATHKRMDYTIREIAALPSPRPFLVMLGRKDDSTPPIINLAQELLGEENFIAESLPYEKVAAYYGAADVFALSSLEEGFGRVYIEALIAGLPCVAHDHPVMRYVLAKHGLLRDLSKPGELASALVEQLDRPFDPQAVAARRESVRSRFSWKALVPHYMEMFRKTMGLPIG